jgi:hypothetical protein
MFRSMLLKVYMFDPVDNWTLQCMSESCSANFSENEGIKRRELDAYYTSLPLAVD